MNFSFENWRSRLGNPFGLLTRGVSQYISLSLVAVLAIVASLTIFGSRPAPAIEELRLIYGPASISLEFQDLETFAETGEESSQLRSLFTLAELNEAQISDFRQALNFGFNVPPDIVNTLLDSSYGRLAVGAFSLFIEAGSEVDDIADDVLAAFRATTRDGRLTFLEVIGGFQGIDVITVNVSTLIGIYNDIVDFGEQAIEFLRAQPEIRELICQ
ncbi:alpha/beta hydrolase [Lyngbya sp. CCY1209]|uniref:alpha/beta hydrolase n=1 Tax=Lyngbya sp. CCY1209 TaxID=2886103 RepID=UPI002D21616E|nr:alpha/beta hydrolase [Lyngbya sp. CCY1209]MEB3884897.1 alpha/beta hydrolase [Lyngbya sp. CCY1209]